MSAVFRSQRSNISCLIVSWKLHLKKHYHSIILSFCLLFLLWWRCLLFLLVVRFSLEVLSFYWLFLRIEQVMILLCTLILLLCSLRLRLLELQFILSLMLSSCWFVDDLRTISFSRSSLPFFFMISSFHMYFCATHHTIWTI